MKCPECGSEVVESSVYCHKCGGRIDRQTWEDPASESPEQPAADEPTSAGQTASERFRGAVESTRAKSTAVTEEALWSGGYCGKAMMDAWVVSGLVTLALLIGAIVVWDKAWVWYAVLAAIVLLWGYQAVVYLQRRLGVRYRLTSQRFQHEKGIFMHTTDVIDLVEVDDITYRQSIIDRLFNVGTIRIVSSDRSHPDLSMAGIADVKNVVAKMDQARRAERIRRGLHISSI